MTEKLIEEARKYVEPPRTCSVYAEGLITRLADALTAQSPAGWKMVPVEPTEGMYEASHKALQANIDKLPQDQRPWRYSKGFGYRIPEQLKATWRWAAMLNAAPHPPAQSPLAGEVERLRAHLRLMAKNADVVADGIKDQFPTTAALLAQRARDAYAATGEG
jgi:hypothetical protein